MRGGVPTVVKMSCQRCKSNRIASTVMSFEKNIFGFNNTAEKVLSFLSLKF